MRPCACPWIETCWPPRSPGALREPYETQRGTRDRGEPRRRGGFLAADLAVRGALRRATGRIRRLAPSITSSHLGDVACVSAAAGSCALQRLEQTPSAAETGCPDIDSYPTCYEAAGRAPAAARPWSSIQGRPGGGGCS